MIYAEKDNLIQGCKVTCVFVLVERLSELQSFSTSLTNMPVEQSILILHLLLRGIGNGLQFTMPVISTALHSHLLHIFFASLQNLTSDLSPWPVDIGHWSSRKPTIDLNTLTKNRLQKGKIVVITTFLNFIPKGSGLRRFPRPITKSMLQSNTISVS